MDENARRAGHMADKALKDTDDAFANELTKAKDEADEAIHDAEQAILNTSYTSGESYKTKDTGAYPGVPEAMPEAKPKAKPKARSNVMPKAKPKVELKAKPQPKPQAGSEARLEAKPKLIPVIKPEATPVIKPKDVPVARPEADQAEPVLSDDDQYVSLSLPEDPVSGTAVAEMSADDDVYVDYSSLEQEHKLSLAGRPGHGRPGHRQPGKSGHMLLSHESMGHSHLLPEPGHDEPMTYPEVPEHIQPKSVLSQPGHKAYSHKNTSPDIELLKQVHMKVGSVQAAPVHEHVARHYLRSEPISYPVQEQVQEQEQEQEQARISDNPKHGQVSEMPGRVQDRQGSVQPGPDHKQDQSVVSSHDRLGLLLRFFSPFHILRSARFTVIAAAAIIARAIKYLMPPVRSPYDMDTYRDDNPIGVDTRFADKDVGALVTLDTEDAGDNAKRSFDAIAKPDRPEDDMDTMFGARNTKMLGRRPGWPNDMSRQDAQELMTIDEMAAYRKKAGASPDGDDDDDADEVDEVEDDAEVRL